MDKFKLTSSLIRMILLISFIIAYFTSSTSTSKIQSCAFFGVILLFLILNKLNDK